MNPTRVLTLILLAIASFTACKKKNVPAKTDVSNFSVAALGPYVAGGRGAIAVTSATLAAGDYTVKYACSGSNNRPGLEATLTIANHTGSFQTPVLNGGAGLVTYVTIDSFINSSGSAAALTGGNLATLPDSTGLMTATIFDVSSFRAVGVTMDTSNSGARIDIGGTYYGPGTMDSKTIFMFISDYTNTTGTYSFYNQFINGGAVYELFTSGLTTDKQAQHGQINITATHPLLTGSFSMTFADSTKISGAFSCPALY